MVTRLSPQAKRVWDWMAARPARRWAIRDLAVTLRLPEPSIRRCLRELYRRNDVIQEPAVDQTALYRVRLQPAKPTLTLDKGQTVRHRKRPCPVCGRYAGQVHQCCTWPPCTVTATGAEDVIRLFGLRRMGDGLSPQPRCRAHRKT